MRGAEPFQLGLGAIRALTLLLGLLPELISLLLELFSLLPRFRGFLFGFLGAVVAQNSEQQCETSYPVAAEGDRQLGDADGRIVLDCQPREYRCHQQCAGIGDESHYIQSVSGIHCIAPATARLGRTRLSYYEPQTALTLWPAVTSSDNKTPGNGRSPGFMYGMGLGLVGGRRSRLGRWVLVAHRRGDGVFVLLAADEEPGHEHPERKESYESSSGGDGKHGQSVSVRIRLVGQWIARLVGGLRRELFPGHGCHGVGLIVVAAQDEPGHDDPESEQSNEGGAGGDGKHFSLSPSGLGDAAHFGIACFDGAHYGRRVLRGFCANVTFM